MKYICISLACLVITGCSKPRQVEFTGKASGVKSGVFVIKNFRDSTLFGVNIKNEQFKVGGIFNQPGFYTMKITDDDDKATTGTSHEVYLDTGRYVISTEKGKLTDYPEIVTRNTIQNEISAYNESPSLIIRAVHDNNDQLAGYIQARKSVISAQQIKYLVSKLNLPTNRDQKAACDAVVLDYFIYKHPNNHIGAHEMVKLEYELDPVLYNEIYQKFMPEVKSSADGKEVGEKLAHLLKLVPGVIAPQIAGKTLFGKPFNLADLHKKVILIDFWRSVNEYGRTNHQKMMDEMLPKIQDSANFGIVSVSLDTKDNWWRDAVAQDKMTWTQVCDLKGDDSPNAANWSISTLPTYCLVDGEGRMIEYNIPLLGVAATANKYMKRH